MNKAILAIPLLFLGLGTGRRPAVGQEIGIFPPGRALIPSLLAGPRDPKTSFSPLVVTDNPNAHGKGVEVEVSLGTSFPVALLAGRPDDHPVVIGIEAGVFARFGLQVLERELINSDWVFAIPVVWHLDRGWLRFRYYHTSSHMGDEYARRFEDPGVNFARDAGEILYYRDLQDQVGIYGGLRYSYNVHPNDSKRWVTRAGGQIRSRETDGNQHRFLAADIEWDQDADGGFRLEVRAGIDLDGVWMVEGLTVSISALTGPSPLGQFNGKATSQVGLSIQKTF